MAEPSREPPFEGGSQPVPQRPPDMPTGRRSPAPFLMAAVVLLILAAGLVFIIR